MPHALTLRASLVAAALCAAACERGAWNARADARVLQVPAPVAPAPVVTAAPAPNPPLPAAPPADPVVALNAVDVPSDVVIDAAYGETSAIAFASDIGADLGAEALAVAPVAAPAPSVVVLPLPMPVMVGSPSPVPAPTPPPALPWGGLPRDPPSPPVTAGSLPGATPGAAGSIPGAAPGTAGTSVAPSSPPIPFGAPVPPTTPGLTAGDPGMLRGTGS